MWSEDSAVLRLQRLLDDLHPRLFPKRRLRRTTTASLEAEVRSETVSKLVNAINEVDAIARESPKRSFKGTGGIPAKVRWYQLMGYLAQVLDGVLRNVDLERYEEKMVELEKTVAELQRTVPQATG